MEKLITLLTSRAAGTCGVQRKVENHFGLYTILTVGCGQVFALLVCVDKKECLSRKEVHSIHKFFWSVFHGRAEVLHIDLLLVCQPVGMVDARLYA